MGFPREEAVEAREAAEKVKLSTMKTAFVNMMALVTGAAKYVAFNCFPDQCSEAMRLPDLMAFSRFVPVVEFQIFATSAGGTLQARAPRTQESTDASMDRTPSSKLFSSIRRIFCIPLLVAFSFTCTLGLLEAGVILPCPVPLPTSTSADFRVFHPLTARIETVLQSCLFDGLHRRAT